MSLNDGIGRYLPTLPPRDCVAMSTDQRPRLHLRQPTGQPPRPEPLAKWLQLHTWPPSALAIVTASCALLIQ